MYFFERGSLTTFIISYKLKELYIESNQDIMRTLSGYNQYLLY